MAKTQQKETLTEDEKKKQIYDMVDNLVKKITCRFRSNG